MAATKIQETSRSAIWIRILKAEALSERGSEAGAFWASSKRLDTAGNLAVPAGRIVPYGTAGIGFITTFGDLQGIEDLADIGTKFTVNYGGGVKFKNLAGPVGFRLDVRGYSVPDAFNQTLNFVEASIGLLFSW